MGAGRHTPRRWLRQLAIRSWLWLLAGLSVSVGPLRTSAGPRPVSQGPRVTPLAVGTGCSGEPSRRGHQTARTMPTALRLASLCGKRDNFSCDRSHAATQSVFDGRNGAKLIPSGCAGCFRASNRHPFVPDSQRERSGAPGTSVFVSLTMLNSGSEWWLNHDGRRTAPRTRWRAAGGRHQSPAPVDAPGRRHPVDGPARTGRGGHSPLGHSTYRLPLSLRWLHRGWLLRRWLVRRWLVRRWSPNRRSPNCRSPHRRSPHRRSPNCRSPHRHSLHRRCAAPPLDLSPPCAASSAGPSPFAISPIGRSPFTWSAAGL